MWQDHNHSGTSGADDRDLDGCLVPTASLPFSPYPQNAPGSSQQPANYPPEALKTIHKACVYGLYKVVKDFLDGGEQDANSRDQDGYVPLHWAAVNNRLDICQMLVARGADVDLRGGENVTPLHWAALYGHFAICHLLASHSKQLNARDVHGFTPFLRAVQGNFISVVVLLRWHGADSLIVDHQGHSALHWASHFGLVHMAGILLAESDNVSMEQQDQEGNTALHIAAKNGIGPIANKLVHAGLSLDARNVDGKRPEDVAAARQSTSLARWLKILRVAPALKIFTTKSPKHSFISLVAIICIVAAYSYYLPVLLPRTSGATFGHMLLLTFTLPMYYSYAKAFISDAGTVQDDAEEVINQLAAGSLNQDEVCLTCIVKKPPRSKHCQVCGVCIEIMDHHCGWINNCVGRKNRLYFLTFTASCFLSLIGFCIVDMTYILNNISHVTVSPDLTTYRFFITKVAHMIKYSSTAFIFFIVYLFYVLFLFAMNCQLAYGIMNNITTNERFNWKRYPHFKRTDGTFVNRFDRGFVSNIKEFFKDSVRGTHSQQRPLLSLPSQ